MDGEPSYGLRKSGKSLGGGPFEKNTLHSLLTNQIYLGKVTYHNEVYEGEHEAIVDPEVFAAVNRRSCERTASTSATASTGDHPAYWLDSYTAPPAMR